MSKDSVIEFPAPEGVVTLLAQSSNAPFVQF